MKALCEKVRTDVGGRADLDPGVYGPGISVCDLPGGMGVLCQAGTRDPPAGTASDGSVPGFVPLYGGGGGGGPAGPGSRPPQYHCLLMRSHQASSASASRVKVAARVTSAGLPETRSSRSYTTSRNSRGTRWRRCHRGRAARGPEH